MPLAHDKHGHLLDNSRSPTQVGSQRFRLTGQYGYGEGGTSTHMNYPGRRGIYRNARKHVSKWKPGNRACDFE